MEIPFGKWKGNDLCVVPIDYLKWAEENVEDMDAELRSAINHEIERRESNRSSLGRNTR